MNKHELFHMNRIIAALTKQQAPANDHNKDGTTNYGNFFPDIKTIQSSLFEMGFLTEKQYTEIEKIIK